MILVTSARGKTGRAVISALVAAGAPVRAMVRTTAAEAEMRALGAAETVAGDLADAEAVRRAAEGAGAIYYIAPNMNPAERLMGDNVIAAAKAAGVSRLVFHSVLHPQIETLRHHWQRHFVEQAIIESGLAFTILQPGSYMQNMLPGWPKMVQVGIHAMPYDPDVPMSLVDLADLAEAAVTVLGEEGWEYGVYELAGPRITVREKAAVLSRVLGKPVGTGKQPLNEFLRIAAGHGAGDYALDCIRTMMPHYDTHGLVGNPKALAMILGRPPTTFEAFARRTAASMKA